MIIVDGYNVIYKWGSLRNLVYNMDLARERLINVLANYQGYAGGDLVIVFDSKRLDDLPQLENEPPNIKIIYAPSGEGADLYIEKMVYASKNPTGITVVTGDLQERISAAGNGAQTLSPERFEREVDKVIKNKG